MEPDFVKTVCTGCTAGCGLTRIVMDGRAADNYCRDRFHPVSNVPPCGACAAEIVREAACPVQ